MKETETLVVNLFAGPGCGKSFKFVKFGTYSESLPSGGNASLDRIDNSKGYIKGNVQWVTKDINMCKRTLNNESFIVLCKKVSQNYEK